MTEKDLTRSQLSTKDPARPQGLLNALLVGAIVLALYAVLILGLRIERLWLFLAYLGGAAMLIAAYQHLTTVP
jgi:hypothetical protein